MSNTPSDPKTIEDLIYFDFDDEELDAAADAERSSFDDIEFEDLSLTSDEDDDYYEDDYDAEENGDYDEAADTSPVPASEEVEAADDASAEDDGSMDDSASSEQEPPQQAKKQADKKRSRAPKKGDPIDPIETKDGIIKVERRKHRRVEKNPEDDLSHPDYTITVTKGLTNTIVRRHYFSYVRYHVTGIALFLVFVALITYIGFSVTSILAAFKTRQDMSDQMAILQTQNNELAAKNSALESKVTQLSQSVNSSLISSQTQAEAYEDSLLPTGFPLTHFSPMEVTFEGADNVVAIAHEETQPEDEGDTETADTDGSDAGTEDGVQTDEDGVTHIGSSDDASTDEAAAGDEASTDTQDTGEGDSTTALEDAPPGNPIAVFTCTEGSYVIATGGGVITRIANDEIFGTMILIDHRNGYISIYRNKGETLVSVGDSVKRGDRLFEIGTGNLSFGYQIKLNDSYINPAAMTTING